MLVVDMETEILKDYRTRKGLAAALNVAELTLIRWEQDGKGPPVTRIGRQVFYSKAGTDKWLRSLEEEDVAA
jgi:hypothetical protein